MFRSIIGIAYLIISFLGFITSVFRMELFEYTSILSVGIWSIALMCAFTGCYFILTIKEREPRK